jgi:hypothetical protein
MLVSEICVCPVVHPKDILRTRCIDAYPRHRSCDKNILTEKRVVEDDRSEVEYR